MTIQQMEAYKLIETKNNYFLVGATFVVTSLFQIFSLFFAVMNEAMVEFYYPFLALHLFLILIGAQLVLNTNRAVLHFFGVFVEMILFTLACVTCFLFYVYKFVSLYKSFIFLLTFVCVNIFIYYKHSKVKQKAIFKEQKHRFVNIESEHLWSGYVPINPSSLPTTKSLILKFVVLYLFLYVLYFSEINAVVSSLNSRHDILVLPSLVLISLFTFINLSVVHKISEIRNIERKHGITLYIYPKEMMDDLRIKRK